MKQVWAAVMTWLLSLLQNCPQNEPRERDRRPPPQNAVDLDARIADILKENDVPGAVFVLVDRHGIIHEGGVGKASLATTEPMTAQTLVLAGSISKLFISLSVMKLVSEGRLDLQTPIATLAPELPIHNTFEASTPLRLVHTLENTTGWQWSVLDGYAGLDLSQSYTLSHWLMNAKGMRRSHWPPGERVVYSNLGPATAAYIVERTVGLSFTDYVKRTWFEPLGISRATYQARSVTPQATRYERDGKTPYDYSVWGPQSSLAISAHEMGAAVQLLLARGRVGGKELIPESALEQMETPETYLGVRAGLRLGYAKTNPSWQDGNGFVWHGHGASVPGALSMLSYRKDQGVGFFFSINKNSPRAKNAIEDLLFAFFTQSLAKPDLPPAAPVEQRVAAQFSGWYRDDSPMIPEVYAVERLTRLVHLSFDERGARLKRFLGPEYRYVSTAPALFRLEEEPVATLALIAHQDGAVLQRGNHSYITSLAVAAPLAMFEITLAFAIVLALTSTVLFSIIWFPGLLLRRWAPAHLRLRVMTLLASVGFLGFVLSWLEAGKDSVMRLGGPTRYAIAITVFRAVLIVSSIAAVVIAKRTKVTRTRGYWHACVCAVLLLVLSVYLFYWDPVGYPGWASSRWSWL